MKVKKGFITQKLDKKTVLFDGEKSILYTFNETASYLFSLLKRGKNKKELIAALLKKYEVTEKKARKDVEELLNDLRKKKIVTGSGK